MNADATMSISLVVLLIGVALNIYGFFNTRKKDIKSDERELSSIGESLVKLNYKTDQLCTSVNEIRLDMRTITNRIGDVEKNMAVLTARIDEHEKRINELREGVTSHEQ